MDDHSILIPAYLPSELHLAMTLKCISRARQFAPEGTKIVIVETVTEHLRDLADIYIHEPKRLPTKAVGCVNRGMQVCDTDYVTLLSTDVFVAPGTFEAMRKCFDVKRNCGVSTVGTTEHSNVAKNVIREFNYWPIVMIDKNIWNVLGGYDEQFGYWCDTDYMMRMYEAGFKMYQNLEVVITHLIEQTKDADHDETYEVMKQKFWDKHHNTVLQEKFHEFFTGELSEGVTRHGG